jgi:hypothetical protein
MHCLEHILLVTSVAVDRDEISKAELVRVLCSLASMSHDLYVPVNGLEGGGSTASSIEKLNDQWHRRFEHLMHT